MKGTMNLVLFICFFSSVNLAKAEDVKGTHQIGEFSREGEYIKDYYIIKEKDTFHNRTIFSAFLWKTNGNFIRFWEIDWSGDMPVVRY